MSDDKKMNKGTLEFKVRVSEVNLAEIKRALRDSQEPGDDVEAVNPGQHITLRCHFGIEAGKDSYYFAEMFNSEYAANWVLQYCKDEDRAVLKMKFDFLILKKSVPLILNYHNASAGRPGWEAMDESEFEELMGEWWPDGFCFALTTEENYEFVNLFQSYGFGHPRLKVVETDQAGREEATGLLSNTFFSLTKVEAQFLEANDQFFHESIRHFETLYALGRTITEKYLPENPEQLQPSDFDSHIVRVAFFLAFLPVALQHYRTILVLLKEGQKVSAACVYRALLELYFDAAYINIRPRTIHRFKEYGNIGEKWKLDTVKKWNLAAISPEVEQQCMASYQKFCARYVITDPQRELKDWAGMSLKKMVDVIMKENDSDLKMFYFNYLEYSSYIHLNSAVADVLEKYLSEPEGAEQQFLDKIFYETIFNGWHIVWHMCTFALITLPRQDSDDKDKIAKFVDGCSKNFNEKERIEQQAHEWQKMKINYYGEQASEAYSPLRREFLEIRKTTDNDEPEEKK